MRPHWQPGATGWRELCSPADALHSDTAGQLAGGLRGVPGPAQPQGQVPAQEEAPRHGSVRGTSCKLAITVYFATLQFENMGSVSVFTTS